MPTMTISGRPLADATVLQLVSQYNKFRSSDSMTDQEFLEKFHQIIPIGSVEDRYGIVTTRSAAELYRLRIQYENYPVGPKGCQHHYSSDVVRWQKGTGKIQYIEKEEVQKIFGTSLPKASWLWLEDVLKMKLGRWPEDLRKDKTPGKRGRPRTKPPKPRGKVGRPRKDAAS